MTLFTPFPWIGLGHLYHIFVYNMNNNNNNNNNNTRKGILPQVLWWFKHWGTKINTLNW